jgi:hypothetical protein
MTAMKIALLFFAALSWAETGLFDDAKLINALPFYDTGEFTETTLSYENRHAVAYKIAFEEETTIQILLGCAKNHELETYLYLLDDEGDILKENAFSGKDRPMFDHHEASDYIRFTAEASKTYYILAASYFHTGPEEAFAEGTYALEVREFHPLPSVLDGATEIETLPFSETDSLTPASHAYLDEFDEEKYVKAYKIVLGNEKIEVIMGNTTGNHSDLEAHLYVLNENGEAIYEDKEDTGRYKYIHVDASLYVGYSYIRFSGPGTYYILASTFNEHGIGKYAIEIREYVPFFSKLDEYAREIQEFPFTETNDLTPDSHVYLEPSGDFEVEKYAEVYKIALNEEKAEIFMSSSFFDTELYLLDEDGNIVIDSYSGYIEYSGTGTYYILASTDYWRVQKKHAVTGTYSIEIKKEKLLSPIIATPKSLPSNAKTEIYNMQGKRAHSMQAKGVYIVCASHKTNVLSSCKNTRRSK